MALLTYLNLAYVCVFAITVKGLIHGSDWLLIGLSALWFTIILIAQLSVGDGSQIKAELDEMRSRLNSVSIKLGFGTIK